jgi:hypothetical protein
VARDRVQKLKTAGKSADEIAASKPFADLDATWGKGFFNGDVFVQVVVPRQKTATVKCPPCNMLHALSVCYSFQMRS